MDTLKKIFQFVRELPYRAGRESHRRALGRMARHLIPNVGTLIVLGLFLLAQSVGAGPPAAPLAQGATTTLLSYQGTLTDADAKPINGNVDMTFALYHEAEGGASFWAENYTGLDAVEVRDGQFHVLLGSQVALNPADLTGDLYLGITVNGEEMLPREQLVSVVDAVNAERAPGNFNIAGKLTMGGDIDMQAHHLQNVDDITSGNPDGGGWGAENFVITNSYGNIRLRAARGMYVFIDADNSGTDAEFAVLKDNDNLTPPVATILKIAENGNLTVSGGGDFGGLLNVGVAGSGEGGEIMLREGSSGNAWYIDNYYGRLRAHHDGFTYLELSSGGNLAVRGPDLLMGPSPRGDGGRALVHWEGDTLVINFTGDFAGGVRVDSNMDMTGHSIYNCGALTEANLQTPEELAANRIDRFSEGDVLCWSPESDRLEKCAVANDPLVQAVADPDGRPIVIGAEVVKVLGPVRAGDILVASDVPGYAMVNNDPHPGTVIAQALEGFVGEQGLVQAMIRKF